MVVDVGPRSTVEESVASCESFQLVTREVRNDEAVTDVDRELMADRRPLAWDLNLP